jgi:biopolymer transport protein ExbD
MRAWVMFVLLACLVICGCMITQDEGSDLENASKASTTTVESPTTSTLEAATTTSDTTSTTLLVSIVAYEPATTTTYQIRSSYTLPQA